MLALVLAGAALADHPIIRFNAVDQAAARATVLKGPDLGTGWAGGFKKPDLSSAPPCANYHPKQSDLVTTGAAESAFQSGGVVVDSEAQIEQTAHMLKLDWQRTFTPGLLPCLRIAFKAQFGTKATVVSVQRTAFPQVAPYTAAIRALIDVPQGANKLRVITDLIVFGSHRTELTLTVTAAGRSPTAVHVLEVQLARLLVSRVHT